MKPDLFLSNFTGSSKVASLRRDIPKTLKKASQKLFASACSLVSFSHSLENSKARDFISFQLKAIYLNYALNLSKKQPKFNAPDGCGVLACSAPKILFLCYIIPTKT